MRSKTARRLAMAPVRDKFVIHSKAIVCQDVELKGDITVGPSKFLICPVVTYAHPVSLLGTVVHPKATIFAIAGPIVIGSGCIIEEGAIIVNRFVIRRICYSSLH
jgi:dynactin-6